MAEIVPSILAADFGRLAEHVEAVVAAGATTVQVDVMDGQFVPNITVGAPVVAALRSATSARLDVHLMIVDPGRYIDDFAAAGSDVITVHVEASRHLHRDLLRIRELGCQAGVALNPATPLSVLEEVLPYVDLVLVMTVNPGFGGQAFIASMLPKIRRLRSSLDQAGHTAVLQVDGGIDAGTAGPAAAAGARQLVAGSAVFQAGVPVAEAMGALKRAVLEATTA